MKLTEYSHFKKWARQKISSFEQGMVVGARRTNLCQELQCCWVFHTQQFPMCFKNGPPPKGPPVNLTQMWEALRVNIHLI
jgi:hypothetical protein